MADRSLDEIISGFQVNTGQLGLPQPSFLSTPTPLVSQVVPPLMVPPPPMAGAAGVFNMQAAQQHQMSLMQAQQQQALGGHPQMGISQPQMMTQPQYGVFREGLQGPAPQQFNIPAGGSPIAIASVPPPMPTPVFSLVTDMRRRHDTDFARRMSMVDAASMQAAAKGLVAGAGAWVGAGVGAAVGGVVGGGPHGALAGANWGSLAGSMAGFSDTVNSGVAWMLEPSLRRAAHGMRLRETSQSFIRGGSQLDVTGRGMDPTSAVNLTRQLGNMAGDQFNQTDMINMTQMAAESGILNMAQNNNQVIDTMKNVVVAIGAIAKMTGNPDVRQAMKNISDMRNFGLTMPETTGLFTNLRTWSRGAGTSIPNLLQQGGTYGASVFQGAGLTAGTGVMVGAASQGLAGAAIGAGAFTPQQLALYGGASGVGQSLTQASAAAMQGTVGQMLLRSVIQTGTGGQAQIDPTRLGGLLSKGSLDFQDLTRMAAKNMGAGGMPLMESLQMNQDELTDQLSRMLGPTGILAFAGNVSRGSAGTAGLKSQAAMLKQMGLPTQTANMLAKVFQSPGTMQNLLQQQKITQQELQVQRENALANLPGPWERAWDEFAGRDLDPRKFIAEDLDLSVAGRQGDARAQAMGLQVQRDPYLFSGKRRIYEAGTESDVPFRERSVLGSLTNLVTSPFSERATAMRRMRGHFLPSIPFENRGGSQFISPVNLVPGLSRFTRKQTDTAIKQGGAFAKILRKGLGANLTERVGMFSGLRAKTGSADDAKRMLTVASSVVTNALDFSDVTGVFKNDELRAKINTDILGQLTPAQKEMLESGRVNIEDLITAGIASAAADPKKKKILLRGTGRLEGDLSALSGFSDIGDAEAAQEVLEKELETLGSFASGGQRGHTRGFNETDERYRAIGAGMSKLSATFGDEDTFLAYVLGRGGPAGEAEEFMNAQGPGFMREFQSKTRGARGTLGEYDDVLQTFHERMREVEPENLQQHIRDIYKSAGKGQRRRRTIAMQSQVQEILRSNGIRENLIGGGEQTLLDVVQQHGDVSELDEARSAIEQKSGVEALQALSNVLPQGGTITRRSPEREMKAKDVPGNLQTKLLQQMSIEASKNAQASNNNLDASFNMIDASKRMLEAFNTGSLRADINATKPSK